ncbi:nodulation protein NfeD [bacterium]|nr:nodulation protein NfeD [bacterium]
MNYRDKFFVSIFLWLLGINALQAGNEVVVLTIDGAITPVTARYLITSVNKAVENGVEAIIICMDTPGGLMSSTLDIDKTLLAATLPVIVYISPSGGRAASAGVFISYAAHLVAMAPSTNIGSAHPVNMLGGKQDSTAVLMEKVTNDAVAHIKGLARQRERNENWAEDAVRNSVNITEEEALQQNVINYIATDLPDLLEQLDGEIIDLDGSQKVLNVKHAVIIYHPMNWRYKILNKIADPNIAYFLMMGAMLGLFFELRSPGALFPGILGGICLILFLFVTQVLHVTTAGVLLIVLAILFFVLEAYTPTFGFLTIGGVIAMLLGSLMLFQSPDVNVSLSVILPAVLIFGSLFVLIAIMGLKAQTRKVVTGEKGLIGEHGIVLRSLGEEWQVRVHGEIWRATSDTILNKDDTIEVVDIAGMVVKVRKIS